MTEQSYGAEVRDGIKDVAPILVAVVPFSVIFGALAIKSGLTFQEMLLSSLSIYAIASQYLMLDLMGQGVPVWLIVLSVFALNFRHVLYSASIGRSMAAFSGVQKALAFFMLCDPQYAASRARADRRPLQPVYYFSYALVLYSVWIAANCIGALFGSLIDDPAKYGFDFVLPLYFTALLIGFRQRTNFLPVLALSASVSVLAYFFVGSPWHITLGGLAGISMAAILSKPSTSSGNE